MPCRRCSTCAINYPTAKTGPCVACGGELNFFSNIDPMSADEIRDAVAKVVWRSTGEFRLYGGVTMMERFERNVASLRGVDDFLLECGDWPAPDGNEDRGGGREPLGPPAPEGGA